MIAYGLHSATSKELTHAALVGLHEAYLLLASCYELPLVSASLRVTVDGLFQMNRHHQSQSEALVMAAESARARAASEVRQVTALQRELRERNSRHIAEARRYESAQAQLQASVADMAMQKAQAMDAAMQVRVLAEAALCCVGTAMWQLLTCHVPACTTRSTKPRCSLCRHTTTCC